MRLVAAVLFLLVFAPAARADVTFTGVPASPTNQVTFDVGFSSPGAVRYDCVHTFPDGHPEETLNCGTTFAFVDLIDGTHTLRVTATDAEGAPTTNTATVVVDTVEPPAPVITTPPEGAVAARLDVTGTTAAGTKVAIFDGATKLGDAVVTAEGWTFETTTLADGPHTVTALASDEAGNTATSPERHITIDTGPPATPTIDAPAEGATLATHTPALTGTTETGTTVAVFEGATKLGDAVVVGGTWTFTTPELADGGHYLKAVATDGNGDPAESAVRHITIDTVAPEVTFSGVPASPTNLFTFDIGFTANDPAATFDCVHVFPDGSTSEQLGCDSPFEMRELTDGVHELRVTAKDAVGNARTETARMTIDTQPPAAVDPVQSGTGDFTFVSEAGATFECSVDGATFAPCASPHQLSGLAAGDHSFAVAAIDVAGNRSETTTRTFTIPAVPAATPDPVPSATPAPAPPPAVIAAAPAAELGRTLVIRPVSGKVYIRRPATSTLLELGAVAAVPVGTEVDARKGRVRVTAAATRGKAAHRAEFFGGMFTVTQAADDIVDLKLSEPFGSCAKKTGVRVRKLWGDGRGRFRMRGQNAIVTVRGTRWLVQDSCEGTLTRVSQGVVSVRDTVKRKTFLVRAGRKYLAVPKHRK